MAIKIMLFVKRRADLTHEQYKARYEAGHAPLARKVLPLLRRYVRSYLSPIPGGPEPVYDSVTEFWFDSIEDMQETFRWAQSSEGRLILAKDEEEFMDRSSMQSFFAEEMSLPGE